MSRKALSLKQLRVTKRPTAGETRVSTLQRDACQVKVAKYDPSSEDVIDCKQQHANESNVDFQADFDMIDVEEPTGYELERKSDEVGWNVIREDILMVVTENAAMPQNQMCLHCNSPASLHCIRCGPLGFFCQLCFQNYHSCSINIFHVAEKWENDHYIPADVGERCLDVRPSHQCLTKRKLLIQCVDEYGITHDLQFFRCNCEPVAITLARANLWPASPHNPRYAFSFTLLDWVESLMLECQVALKDFCNALKFMCPFQMLKKKEIYPSLVNAFEEYRFLKHNLRHLAHVSSDLDSGNVCPACPQSKGGQYVYAMDAVFGLPRKTSAGTSHRGPLHGNLFFSQQSIVDQYVLDYNHSKTASNDCNDFLAGSVLRSVNRYRGLDETAIFGACCRHEFPKRFISLKHGERLAYPIWLLERILESHSDDDAKVFFFYDIACTIVSHLKSRGRTDILNKVHLCLPSFHSYGHKASCQMLFSPQRCDGIGLSDGETMERLWSYLRRFGRMTKEMRPSHRVDVLTSALVFYGIQTKRKLASLLLLRWERCIKTKQIAQDTLHQNMHGTFEEMLHIASKWLSDETASYPASATSASRPPQWRLEYFHVLQTYNSQKQHIASGHSQEADNSQLALLEVKLLELEKKHSIQRWVPATAEFKECEFFVNSNKMEQLLLEIWRCGQKRLFLLNMKRKYADGQKIAKKLSLQISKETKGIKRLLQQYNACQCDEGSVNSMLLTEALDPSLVQIKLQKYGTNWHMIADGKKRDVIDAYLTYCRSQEEMQLLMDEAKNVVEYYDKKRNVLINELQLKAETDDQHTMGTKALLHHMLKKVDFHLSESKQTMDIMRSHDQLGVSDDYTSTSDVESSDNTDLSDIDDC